MTERDRKDFFQAIYELHQKITYVKLMDAESSDLIILMNSVTFAKLCVAYQPYVMFSSGVIDEHYISFFGVEVKIAPTLDDDQLWLMKRMYEVDIEHGND